jgi:DNA mismatch repair ATPase MutS
MWRIAASPLLHPVTFAKETFILKECSDISLNIDDAVTSSIELSAQPHAILTGPNGGGKSSFLRAVLQSVLIGHAFGFAPAKEAYMPRFVWIASGLQLRDTPGKFSMFETEVKFAADTVRAASIDGPGLVLFDELFHSTNPPDSERSAIQFLGRLWKKTQTFSIVSTHLFPLVSAAPANVQAICCDAKQLEKGEIEYSYGVQRGLCKVSSVHKVWEKFGLARHAARSNSEQQSLNATQK